MHAFSYAICGFAILIVLYFVPKKNIASRYFFGLLLLITSFFVGITTASIHKQTFYSNHYAHILNESHNKFIGTILITEKLKNTDKNYRYVAEIKSIEEKKHIGKIIFNISKKKSMISLPIGSMLKVKATYYKNKNPFNPNQFEYSKYLEHQEIYGQLYTNKVDVKIIDSINSIRSYFANYREELIIKLKRTSLSQNSLSVIVALLLGQKQDISPVLLKEYQAAGAVHILAVSGLHVGIIMIILLFILKSIPNSRKGSFIKLVVVLLSLWSFALLAGLSPSVVRSVTMFSFLTIGINLRRTVNIYHTILVSMLLILLINPGFIYDVGFQLSYLAVFFIIWLQPKLRKIWIPKNKIISYFWDILTVSTAAQIGVLPLSIYYFHQFPGLFFVTNLVIIPLLLIIMAIGILVLLLLVLGIVPTFLVTILEGLLQLMNYFIHLIASCENFILRNISFTSEMLWLSYIAIIALIFWAVKPSFKRISFALVTVILLQLSFINQKNKIIGSSEVIVFNEKKNTVILQRIGNEVTLFANDSVQENSDENSTLQSYLVGNFSHINSKKSISNFVYINSKKVIIIDSSAVYNPNLTADIVIIIQSPKVNLDRLLKAINPKIVIADGSNYKTYSKLWKETCRKQKIPFHNTPEKGFYKF
ncbi:ComEC/Rec2 family competence protein [Flavobacterium sp.]